MIANNVINYTGGTSTSLTGREYLSPVATDTLVIALHPDELRGPADGSQLNRLETIDWWPKFAKTVDYPFNIFAVQNSGSTFHYLLKNIIKAMKARYNPKNIVLLGIGRGAFDVYNILSENTDPEIKLVITVSGGSDRTGSIFKWPGVKGIAWHGNNDSRYPIQAHQQTVSDYNRHHGSKGGNIQFNAISGVGYEAWNVAFNPDPAKDQSLKFVIDTLKLGQPTTPNEDPRLKELEAQMNAIKAQLTEALNALQ
jgi:hypothetical protein